MKRFFLFALILTLIFIGSACKKSEEIPELQFNIIGSWDLTMTTSQTFETFTIEFKGDTKTGTWSINIGDNDIVSGTYQVGGDTVKMIVTGANFENGITGNFTGQFENENKISGSWIIYDDGSPSSGTWVAIRN